MYPEDSSEVAKSVKQKLFKKIVEKLLNVQMTKVFTYTLQHIQTIQKVNDSHLINYPYYSLVRKVTNVFTQKD